MGHYGKPMSKAVRKVREGGSHDWMRAGSGLHMGGGYVLEIQNEARQRWRRAHPPFQHNTLSPAGNLLINKRSINCLQVIRKKRCANA